MTGFHSAMKGVMIYVCLNERLKRVVCRSGLVRGHFYNYYLMLGLKNNKSVENPKKVQFLKNPYKNPFLSKPSRKSF